MSFGYNGFGYGGCYEQEYCGYGCGYGYESGRTGGGFALIVVLFILLIIVGAAFYC